MNEISDDELERRMRAKLFSGGPKIKKQLSDEDQKIAEKLMGRTNARKLANPNLDRPFRYRPLVVMAEYYEVPPINGRYGPDLEGGWNVDLIEDGVKKTLVDRGDWEECRDKIRQLSAKGIPVKKFETDRMRENAAKSKADRLARKQSRKTLTINHLKGFRL